MGQGLMLMAAQGSLPDLPGTYPRTGADGEVRLLFVDALMGRGLDRPEAPYGDPRLRHQRSEPTCVRTQDS